MLAIAAMAIIALSFALTARPVLAADQVDNHQLDDGKTIDSSDPNAVTEDPKVCDDGGFDSGVTWHFVLTKYESGDADIFGHFADAGDFGPIDSADRNGSTLFFYVNTPTDDVLETNWAILDTADADAQLQLSSVCHGPEEEESAPESAEQSVEASGEQSVEAGTGTPEESTPDGSLFGNGSNPLPTIAFSLILLASLGGLAYANVKTVRNRI
jgi:hypothetical protein